MNRREIIKMIVCDYWYELIALFFFLIIITSLTSSPMVKADYNITSNYCKTEFNNSKWIRADHDLLFNYTNGYVQLNASGATSRVYEDYTTFTEIDAVNRLSQTPITSWFVNIYRDDDDVLLYKNMPNRDEDFTLEFRIYIINTDSSGSTRRMIVLSWSQSQHDENYHRVNNQELFGIELRNDADTVTYGLNLIETENGNKHFSATSLDDLSINVLYYVRFIRVNKVLSLYVDNDADFSSPIAGYNPRTLTMVADYTWCNNLCTPQSIHLATHIRTYGYVQYLWFGNTSLGYDKGVLYTENLLVNTTMDSIMVGMNSTAPADTRVRLYTSNDNTTWTLRLDNNELGQQELYKEILYEYSTLYVLINMTTLDGLKTPYLDEMFYLHATLGGGGGIAPLVNPWWLAILFILTPLSIVLFLIFRRKG